MKFIILIGLFCIAEGRPERLDYFQHTHPEISEFFRYLSTSPFLKSAITWKQGTLFVPKNEAISEYISTFNRDITNTTLLYHFCNYALPLTELEQERFISTEISGNSPIWITKTNRGIFLNDAKYIIGNFEVQFDDRGGSTTIVHIVDRVLEPAVPGSIESPYLHNPDAGKLLEHLSSYKVASDQLATVYHGHVSRQGKMQIYKDPGFRTYFIPVDEAFRLQRVHLNAIDSKVIYGHIIPKTGIFLRTIEGGEEYYDTYKEPKQHGHDNNNQQTSLVTDSNDDKSKEVSVVVSFEKTIVDGKVVWLVNSDNLEGDDEHRKGVVQAEIIRGNIPVKNGVVHLISKPLVIIDLTVLKTLEFYATKQRIRSMYKFLELLRKLSDGRHSGENSGSEIKDLLENHQVTIFVPTNEAIENCSELQQKMNNFTAIAEILKTHILRQRISADDMIEHSKMKKIPFQIQSVHSGRKILFSSFTKDGNKSIHLEGGGVNATVLHADFGATNGFIHIIDRVLGVPDQTIQEKLRTHPMLQSTYHIWRTVKMEDRLNRTNFPITFFAPSENAWMKLKRISDSAYHNFFHSTQPTQMLMDIFDRHIILEQNLSIEKLVSLSLVFANKTVSKGLKGNLTVSRDPIKTSGSRGYVKVNESRTLLQKEGNTWWTTTQKIPISGDRDRTSTSIRIQGNEMHYYVYWERMWAHVVRTNVKCTNGVIHVIDDVLMDNDEIAVSRTTGQPGQPITLIILLIILSYFGLIYL